MVEALLLTYSLEGLTREQVNNLLGKPPQSNYFTDWDYVYRLGNERGLISIDSEWLVLDFNGRNRVVRHAVVRD